MASVNLSARPHPSSDGLIVSARPKLLTSPCKEEVAAQRREGEVTTLPAGG